jgi:hypothetical protein
MLGQFCSAPLLHQHSHNPLCCVCCAQVNRFARDTGYSVAIFSVGGIYDTEHPESMEDPACCIAPCVTKNGPTEEGLKVAVLKYATGGVASNLITRGEITKFVAQRGVKAIADMFVSHQAEASA